MLHLTTLFQNVSFLAGGVAEKVHEENVWRKSKRREQHGEDCEQATFLQAKEFD